MVKLAATVTEPTSGIGAHCSSTESKYAHRHFLSESADVSTTHPGQQEGLGGSEQDTMADGDEKFIYRRFRCQREEGCDEGADNQRAYYYIDGIALRLHPEDDRDKDGVPDKEDSFPARTKPA
ncbi:MAG: hypothetical protein IPL64_17280 [Flavobacteriales bacterium]|nr:hypothetical protein [Flavobacteriales bacterium]